MAKKPEQQPAAPAGADELEAALDQEHEQGYFGTKVDPTPNEAYTVSGVLAGEPTPETDAGLEHEAREAAGLSMGGLEQAESLKKEGDQ
jgi:hypothetical protein